MLLELSEWSRRTATVQDPTLDDLDLAARLNAELDRKLDLRWLRDGRLEVISTSWVGVVRLSNLTIHVRPKYAGDELGVVRMLEYAAGTGSLRPVSASRTLPPDGANLLDLLCALLVSEAENLVRDGLLHDYSTEEAALPALRGSLRFREQATRRFGQLDVLECRFDEFHADVLENQLLRTGLAAASRVCGDRATRQRLRRAESTVADLATVGPVDSSYYRHRLNYGRRNERYRRAHDLALLLLDRLGIEDLYGGGKTKSFAFLLNMNEIFESFVTTLVAEAFADGPWRVSRQHREGSVIRNRRTGKRYASIIPDIVLSDRRQQIPFDCKYKLYGDGRKLSSADIYQSFVYAYALSSESPAGARAGILYPADRPAHAPLLGISRVDGPITASITGIGLDLRGVLRSMDDLIDWNATLDAVRSGLGEVLEPVPA